MSGVLARGGIAAARVCTSLIGSGGQRATGGVSLGWFGERYIIVGRALPSRCVCGIKFLWLKTLTSN